MTFKSIRNAWAGFALATFAALGLAACGTTNDIRTTIGLEGEYVDVCSPLERFEDQAVCVGKVYYSTLEAISDAAEAEPGETTDQLLVRVAVAEKVATPVVNTGLQAVASYIFYRDLIEDYRASGETVPPDIFQKAEQAYVHAVERWAQVEPQIKRVQNALSGDD